MEDRFREISTENVTSRLSRQICRLVKQIGIRSNGSVKIKITREELAQMIGTSLFTVSRLLSEWDIEKGIVTTRREGFSVDNLQASRSPCRVHQLVRQYGISVSLQCYGAAGSSQKGTIR